MGKDEKPGRDGDIRKFFGGGGAAKSASKPKHEPEEKPAAPTPPAKKPKTEPAAVGGGTSGAGPSSAAAVKSPPSKAHRTPPSTAKKPPARTPRSAAAKRKQAVIESDSEGMVDLVDSDFEIDLGEEEPDSDDSSKGGKVEDEEEDEVKMEEEVKPKPKPPTKKRKPSATSQEATPRASKPRRASSPKGPLAMISHDPVAMAAVAAVNAAVAQLPPESELDVSFMSEAAFNMRAPDEPPLWGTITPPHGHPDCLTGKTFVISGVLDSLKRPEAEDLIKRHGGRLTGNVSSRTSFLLIGHYARRSKYQAAKEHNVPLIKEEGLFALISAAPAPEREVEELPAAAEELSALPAAAVAAPSGSVPAAGFYSAPAARQAPIAAVQARPAGARVPAPNNGQLWVEKWRPKTSAELVGNKTIVDTLRQWLKEWQKVHLHGGQPSAPPGSSKKDRTAELKRKAAIMSGSPGIGKTSAALIVARECGFEPVEVNASDARSKADAAVIKGVGGKLANAIKELSTNVAISVDPITKQRKKLCLIMDEVDGMSAGDRGGVADLIKTIAASKVPIICICNDKYSMKLRSLRNHCLELDFRKPTVQQISKRMLEICAKEGLTVNQATMDALVQSATGGDIRLILGQLQMVRLRARSLSYDQVKGGGMGTAKDLELSPFEAARRLLDHEGASLSLADQIELVFQDSDLVPLLVQENYLNHRPRVAGNEAQRIKVLAKAADGFSAGDLANTSVRRYQNWSLMPFAAAMGTVYPATWVRGGRETFGLFPSEPNFPRFTAWLGHNSSSGKQRRLLGELHTRMLSSGAVECDRTALRLAYLPVLRGTLTRPLLDRGKEGIPQVLQLMRAYCLSRDDMDFITDVTKFKTKAGWGEDPFKGVETAVKSAFTRAFNQQHLRPKTGFKMEEGKKKGRGRKGAAVEEEEEEGLRGEGEAEAAGVQEEEEEEEDPEVLRRKLVGMKHKGLELTLKDGSKATKPARGSGKARGGAASGSRGRGRGAKK